METSDAKKWLEFWMEEQNGAWLYDVLAETSAPPTQKDLFRRLAETERRHAEVWAGKLRAAHVPVPEFHPSVRIRLLGAMARKLGVHAVLPSLVATEDSASSQYANHPDAAGLIPDEQSHSRLLKQLSLSGPSFRGTDIARLEGRHRAIGGNALRAAVLGANDGLVSNLSLVMGVAGAALANQTILLTGIAGLLAGALSMALGEWLSVQSSRELHQKQLAIEKEELANAPEEEREELVLIYQAKGLPEAQARDLADRILKDPAKGLDTLAREELGIDPDELGGSAWEAAAVSFLLFAGGALLPVLPFLFWSGDWAVPWSAAFSSAGLLALGAGTTLFTGLHPLLAGLRQVLFGLAAAGLTYGIGRLLGVTLAG